jgi:hypothetical protein
MHNENTKRQGFLSECEGFSLNSIHGSQIEDFLQILCQGARVFAYSAEIKIPNSFKSSKDSHSQAKGDHHNTNTGVKISFLLPKFQTSLVQTSGKACSTQTGDGWSR